MKAKKFIIYIFIFIVTVGNLKSQDVTFSQFYANPLFLNPALTGNTECGRLNLNYRNQWPSFSKAYNTYNLSFDQALPNISSGYGLIITSDQQANNTITNNQIGGLYSYHLQASYDLIIHAGIQVSYHMSSINWDKLVFADQIDINGNITNTSGEIQGSTDKNFFDFSGGMTFGYKDKYYGGVAVHHMTQPDNSFTNDNDAYLPMRITLHGGAIFDLNQGKYSKRKQTISPNILFQQQGKFHQLNTGLYANYEPFIAGVWFRHNFENSDAAIILLGLQMNNINIGYSFDYTLSKLSGYSGGAHEISLSYEFCIYHEKRRKIRAIKCPKF